MDGISTQQDLDKFLATPLDKQKRPAMGTPPAPVAKKPLPEFKSVQDLDSFLKTPIQQYDTAPVKKFTEARQSRERTSAAETAEANKAPWYADRVLSDKGIGKAIGLASKLDEPLERGIHTAEEWVGKKIDQAADLMMKPERDQRDWLAANGYPTLAKIGAYSEAVNPINIHREAFKAAAGMVVDPKNWPFLLEGGGTVRPALKQAGTALFTVMQQYGAVQALQNRDWASAAMQEAFALLGMKDLSLEVKAKVGEAALEKHLDTLAQGKYKKPWNQLTKPEQAGLAYDMANAPKPLVPSAQVAAKAAKGAGEPTAGPKAFDLATQQARGTEAARQAVPLQMMPTPPGPLPFEPVEKQAYNPVTGGVELPQYLQPEEREAKGYYTLEEARKRLDEERKIATEAEESRSRAEGEQQRISRERAEQAEGESAYREARSGRRLVVEDRRTMKFDEAGAERNRQEKSRLSDELNRIANENMYYDAEDMFQSLDTTKMRGKELEDWQKEALSLQTKLKDLDRLSNPEVLAPVVNIQGLAEDTKLASREGEMRDVASILEEEARKVVGDVDEFEKLQAEADEAKDRAEKLRTERDENEAKRAAETSDRAEYPLGAPIESTRGTGGAMILPDGRKVPFHYAVVPMEAVISSHDPFNNFEPNPEAIAVSQGRDYKNNKESQAATIARGKNPEMSLLVNASPTAETGPPIIRSDGQALGGRNRVNIWKLLYRNGFEDSAYQYMTEHAREFGVTPEQVADFYTSGKKPMVVRVLDDPYESAEALAQLGRDLDRTQTMGFSDAETAVMAGRSLTPETLDWISNQLDAMGEDSTLRDLMRFRSGEIIDKMLASGMIEATKRAEFVTSSGEMTERAKDLFESAVLGKVIDDAELLATTPKDVLRKLERSVGALVRVKASGGVWDFTPELKGALRLWKRVDSIREALNKIGGSEDSLVDRYLHPGEYKMGTELMDFGGETAREPPHPTVEALAKLLEEPGKEIKLAVGDYADDSEGKQMTLGPPPSPVESFNRHIASKVKVDVPEEAWGTLKASSEFTPGREIGVFRGAIPGKPGYWFTENRDYASEYVGGKRKLEGTRIKPNKPLRLQSEKDAQVIARAIVKTSGEKVDVGQLRVGLARVDEALAEELLRQGYDWIYSDNNGGEPTGRVWIRLEAAVGAPKEKARDVPPPLESPTAKTVGAATTASDLEALAGRNPQMAPVAKELVNALGIVIKNATGMELTDWLQKNKISVQDVGEPGAEAMSQAAGGNVTWARGAGRKLTITPFGEQLDLFGGAEPQFMLRDERRGVPDANKERLVLKSELMKLRDDVPRLSELVDADGNILQAQLFGPEEDNLFGPGPDLDEPSQGTLFQEKSIADIAQPKRDTDTLKQVQAEHPDWTLSQQLQEAAKRVKEPPLFQKSNAGIQKWSDAWFLRERLLDRLSTQREAMKLEGFNRGADSGELTVGELLRLPFERKRDIRNALDAYASGEADAKQLMLLDKFGAEKAELNKLQSLAEGDKGKLFQGPKGATEFLDDGRTIITLFRDKADASTFLHEFFHTMRRYLKPEDLAVLEKWQGVKDGIWTRTHEEEAARAWEHYHRQTEGKTLPEKVQMVFKRIQATMKKIYASLKDSPLVKPSKEVAALFDRWYGKEMAAPPETKAVQDLDAKPTKFKFGNTQANIPGSSEAAQALNAARARIADEDLAGKGKDVDGNHITVRYGIKGDDTAGIKRFLSDQQPFEATLGKTETFPPSESSDGAAVIKAPIEALELHRLNDELQKHGEFTDPTFKYSPHATVAYVKPEAAEKYVGMEDTAGKKFTITEIAISNRNGEKEIVKLGEPLPAATEKIKPATEMESPPLSAEDRKDMEMKAQGGILPLDTGKVRVKVFPDFDKARSWAQGNQGKIKGLQIFQLKDGRAVADFTAKNEKVLFQSDPDMEKERMVAHTNVQISNILDRMKRVLPEAERMRMNAEIQKLRTRRDAALNPPKEMTPPPGQILTLWTPEGERPIERPSGTVSTEKKASNTSRGATDVSHGNRQPVRPREISEPPIPPRLSESEPAAGRGTGPSGRGEGKRATAGEPRTALRDVKPLEIAPSKPRGEPAYAAADWTGRVDKFKLPEGAPIPTVKISEANARMLMPGQREIVESILSGLQQHDGYILATTTGSGKSFMGATVLSEMSNPNSRNLILTPSQGLIHGRDGWIRVAGNFGVEVKPLEVGEMPTEPGTYIATWAGGLTREGIDQLPWDLIVMDEVQEARKWWSSKRGDMSKTMGENAKKILYTSATPFHTALEMGHMGKLGLWGREGFAQWAMKNNLGVYFDKDGNLAGGAAPARLEKLRQQLIERGQFINIDRNMTGYSAHFGKVPMDAKTSQGLRDIDKALSLAENYFAASHKKGMVATVRAQRTTLAKRWLEYQRLPQAIELGKKLEKEGWKVIFFSENKKEFNELFDFLKPADAATNGQISRTMPKFGSTIDALREEFGDDIAFFTGKHSAAREQVKDDFNDDAKSHLYATYAAGGVGVSLHDKAGDKPRAVVYLGPPWSGISFDQALGRPWRYGTKSNVRAYFLFSDSQAEMDLVTNKVAPRMESLRAMVSGVDFKDPVVKNLREVPENQEGALDYDHGNAHNADFDAFTRKADMSGVSSYSELPIVSAQEAMHKGMKLPGSEGAQDPSVIRLWQDSVDDEVLPGDLEAPELTMARQVNVELAERFIETGAAPGNSTGRALKPQERRVVADAVLARADAAASTDPASATQQVYTEWENAMKQIDGILALANGGGMEPPPEGIPGVPGSGAETPQPWKMSTWDAVNWYMFTNGRDVMRDVTKRAGVPWVGEKLARSVQQYHTEAGNISGPWETKYWDILKDNKITPEEHKVLSLTLANREKPAKWIDAELARLRATAPMNERIEKAVKQTQDLFKEVFNRMQKDNIYLTVHDAATGRPRQIYYNEFAAGEGYFPRRYDYSQVHTVVDPKTGLEHKFTLADLTDQEPGESKREGIIRGMMDRHGLSRASVEDWLASKKRDVPLVGHIERAREADLPFFRTDPDVVISYLEGAGELLSRKKYFEQDGSKVKGMIAQIPAQKAREIVGGIMDSLLQRNPLHDESKAILRWTSNWAVSKMVFSSLKALTHSIHAAPLTNTRAYLKGVFAGLTDLKDVQRMAQLAGSIQEQTKVEMLAEYGVKKSGFGSKFLTKTGWQGIYKWGRVVSDATARIFMTDYAMGKLMKDPKNEVVRRQLRNNMQLDDSRIDAAIARRRWTEEDLAWGGKSMADKTMMTFDKTELPPGWRPRSDDPASDFGGTILRAATILKGYQFKAHAVMKDAIWDEARKGNFRPLIPFLLLYPAAGQMIWSLTALATGNLKHFKQLMDDKTWTPGRTLWHIVEDIAHIMADSEATAFFDAAVHGKEILAGKIGTEYVMGPLPSDVGKTVMLPVDITHAKTAKAKAAAVRRYVENINPAARTLFNAYDLADTPTQQSRGMTPLPVIHR